MLCIDRVPLNLTRAIFARSGETTVETENNTFSSINIESRFAMTRAPRAIESKRHQVVVSGLESVVRDMYYTSFNARKKPNDA